jgi:hypothetical protein
MIRHLSILTLFLVMMLTGCAYSLHPYTRPTDVKLRVQSARPGSYVVRVTATEPASDYSVMPEGRVAFTVPSFRRGCSTYLFDVVKIGDATPERIRVIEVRRGQRVVRKLSLSQIAKLPEDEAGYRIVKFEQ